VPASLPLYHDIRAHIIRCCDPTTVPLPSVERLALLVTGVIAAQRCVLAHVATELDALALTDASGPESIGRRLRRTLNDPYLTWETSYAPLLTTTLDWPSARDPSGRIVLILDESSHTDHIHLLRLSLPYRGGSLPIAWTIWAQNTPLEAGAYWTHVDGVLNHAATILPPGAEVVVLADRAYAIPALIDRLAARGWHWIVRLTTTGSHRFWPDRSEETALSDVVTRQLAVPGSRWRQRGRLFKDAGWRDVALVGLWGTRANEPLLVMTDLTAEWEVLACYERRFWIEAGFRNDKSRGWQWESCQVRGLSHHAVVLLALAWASVLVLCVGAHDAACRLHRLADQPPRQHGTHWRTAKPQPARESLFTLGVRQIRRRLYATRRSRWHWRLPALAAPSWTAAWRAVQSHRFLFPPPVRS
jgi:hypothetical protein